MHALLNSVTSNDFEWLSKIFNDTKRRAVSLRQLSFLVSRRLRQLKRLHATGVSICSSVCLFVFLSVCRQLAKTRFSQKLSNLELWSPLTTYRKSYIGFSKNPLFDPWNPRWLRSAILKIDMTSFFSAEGGPIWIKFHRLEQNDMSTAVMWSKSKPDVEFQYGGRLGEFNGMSS